MIVIINKRFLKLLIILLLVFLLVTVGIILFKPTNTEVWNENDYALAKPIDKGQENSKYIAFACNIDWGNEVIPDILQILNEQKIKITFFITGRWAQKYPDIMQTIVDAGHEIGSHGYEHLDYSSLPLDKNEEQIQKADKILTEYTKQKILFFSPPSGAYNDNTLIAANKFGYKTILWTIDTIDWRSGSTKDVIIERVRKKDNFNGAIVLMHPMPETVKALPGLIEIMREKDVKVGRISDILHD